MNTAEEGGGKIKYRKSSKANTPYSRPQHRRSVLSRVTDSVKNLLVPITPQWLLSKSNNTEESISAACSAANVRNLPSCSAGPSNIPTVPNVLRVISQEENSAVPAESTQGSLPNQTSLEDNKTSSPVDKELKMKLLEIGNKEARPQATAASPKEPKFNPSSLGLFSHYTPRSSDKSIASSSSSFYPGPTRYGGLMGSPRSEASSRSPYAIPRLTRVRVKQNTTSNSTAGHSSTLVGKSDQQMSSTALKILQTLEKMASPINDAKKIPSSSQKLNSSLLMIRQRKRRRENNSINNNDSTNQKPPVTGLAMTTPAAKRFAHAPNKSRTVTTATSSAIAASSKNSFGGGTTIGSTATSTITSTPSIRSSDRGGGKMKNPRSTSSHYSSPDVHNEHALPTVPDIPLIPASKPLPSFNFGIPASTSTPNPLAPRAKTKNPVDKKISQIKEPSISFQFSSPALKSNDVPASTTGPEPKFAFSTPTSSMKKANAPIAKTNNDQPVKPALIAGSVMDILGGKSSAKTTEIKTNGEVATKTTTKSESPATKSTGAFGLGTPSPKPNTTGIIVSSKAEETQVKTTVTKSESSKPDPVPAKKPEPKSAAPAPTVKSKWTCDICMVPNAADKDKCVCCEAPRPGSAPAKSSGFGSSTMGSSSTSGSSSFKFGVTSAPSKPAAAAPSKWTCDICMVPNAADKDNCVCCEAPRPGSAPTKSSSSGFKASFGTSAPATSSFKFGISGTTPSTKPSISSDSKTDTSSTASTPFTFGISSSSNNKLASPSTKQVPQPEKKTGEISSSSTKKDDESNFKYGSAASSLFKFGVSSEAKTEASKTQVVTASSSTTIASTNQPASTTSTAPTTGAKLQFGAPSALVTSKSEEKKPTELKTTPVVTSNGGFKFGATDTTASTAAAAAPAKSEKPMFSFGAPTKKVVAEIQPETKKEADVASAPGQAKKLDSAPAAAGFKFGSSLSSASSLPSVATAAKDEAPAKTAAPATFKFGAAATSVPSKPAVPSFGAAASTASNSTEVQKPTFAFGSSNPIGSNLLSSASKPEEKKPAGFTFGSSTTSSSVVKPTEAAKPFSFGSNLNNTAEPPVQKPAFSFGSNSTSSAPSSTVNNAFQAPSSAANAAPPAFGGFGQKVEPTPQKSTAPFKFGAGQESAALATPSSGFSFGSKSTTNDSKPSTGSTAPFTFGSSKPVEPAAAAAPSFGGFGSTNSTPFQQKSDAGSLLTTPAAAKPGFSFGSAPPAAAPAFGSANSTPAPAQSGFNFGSNTSTPTFGKSEPIPKPTFNFGASQETKPATGAASTGFSFGASNPAPNTGGAPFTFGAQQSQPASNSGFQFNAVNPTPQQSSPAAFSGFGASASPAPSENSMFSIGGGGGAKQTKRVVKTARRRLRK